MWDYYAAMEPQMFSSELHLSYTTAKLQFAKYGITS